VLLRIPKVLSVAEVADFRGRLAAAGWADGRITAGFQSARAKDNQQLPEGDPVARELSVAVRAALDRSTVFFAAALPRRIFPPLFNRYRSGHAFGNHVDNAVRYDRSGLSGGQGAQPVRTDLSATVFLSGPDEYDGGELVIGANPEAQRVKLPAGDMLLYSATSVHRVESIARGERLASFFWIQSLVRDDGQRGLLFDLDVAIQKLNLESANHPAMVELVGVYHNLLRRWTEI
jgi:PKHD-type hydroxylase